MTNEIKKRYGPFTEEAPLGYGCCAKCGKKFIYHPNITGRDVCAECEKLYGWYQALKIKGGTD